MVKNNGFSAGLLRARPYRNCDMAADEFTETGLQRSPVSPGGDGWGFAASVFPRGVWPPPPPRLPLHKRPVLLKHFRVAGEFAGECAEILKFADGFRRDGTVPEPAVVGKSRFDDGKIAGSSGRGVCRSRRETQEQKCRQHD